MLDPAAAAWFTEPSIAITGHQYLHDRTFPLWNPYQGFGRPYAGNMQSQAFFPLTVLFSLHVTPKSYNLFLLFRLFIAGMGAYLFLRLFVSFIPALTGGVVAMLAGYYVMEISQPYLSVEILIPFALFVAELLLRKPSRWTICGFAVVVALVILGGMPESGFLLFLFVYGYLLFRTISDPAIRRVWFKQSIYVLVATVLGVCLSALLVLPFLELLRHSYNSHDPSQNPGHFPGEWIDLFDVSIFTYMFPLLLGHPYAPTLPYLYNGNGARNYSGIIPFFLAITALLSSRRWQTFNFRRLSAITWFFFGCVLLILLKRFGFPPLNVIDTWPVLRQILIIKYDEPILGVCIAVLAGIGLEHIANATASRRVQIAAVATAFTVVVTAVLFARDTLNKEVRIDHTPAVFPIVAIVLPVSLLLLLVLCYRLWPGAATAHRLAIAVLLLVAGEMSLNYIAGLYYVLDQLPDTSENPYAGAPYINWLKQTDTDSARVFGRGGELYPDWASVFQLADVRDLDALYYWKYLPFVRNFLVPGTPPAIQEFHDRFTGAGNYEYGFTTPLERRFLQLSSTRYLITNTPYSQADFELSYDREVKIYRYDHVLPRAAVYSRAEIIRGDEHILERLADPAFDPFTTVLLNAAQLSATERDQVAHVNQGSAQPAQAGAILAYRPRDVEIDASVSQNGVLVLNDSDYPGWKVNVDGRPAKSFSANYIFRAVFLPAGTHRVSFYYAPRTFHLGLLVSVLAAGGMLLWCFAPRRLLPRRAPIADGPARPA